MNYPELFIELNREFSEDISLGVCIAAGIHMITNASEKDFYEKGRYAKKVNKKIRKALWEYSKDDIKLILDIESKIHDWEFCRTLEGLGGCTRKTFKELIGK